MSDAVFCLQPSDALSLEELGLGDYRGASVTEVEPLVSIVLLILISAGSTYSTVPIKKSYNCVNDFYIRFIYITVYIWGLFSLLRDIVLLLLMLTF